MITWRVHAIVTLLVLLIGGSATRAAQLSGHAAAEGTFFGEEPLYANQVRHSVSIASEPEFYHAWRDGSSLSIMPFLRIDSADPQRSHFDFRELHYLWIGKSWELRLGVSRVFWGAAEFVHLVDIINQTDQVEDFDNEAKLGQPMLQLSLPGEWSTLEFFVLPGFRERTFPGQEGRFRGPLVVDVARTEYESSSENRHVDFAARYSRSFGAWDLGFGHFRGTGRTPTLRQGFKNDGAAILYPYYELISQSSVDLQGMAGAWLLKLEALHRSGQGPDFFAAVAGWEYSFPGLGGSGIDLNLLGEWTWDERGGNAMTIYQNDLALGLRLALNDPSDTQLLAGLVTDLEDTARVLQVEASRRIGDRWRAILKGYLFSPQKTGDAVHALRADDSLRLELAYYF